MTPTRSVIRRRVRVSGRVQGVFYRDSCRQMAAAYGVSGWARNRPDGAVEAVFEGPPDGVAALLAWAARGPAQAVVTGVEVTEEPPEGIAGFSIG